ncbi:MAG TPA: type II toxin-antitoxin system RelE/ParE family toxin [Candidatus Hydrogenedentes bacterium]|nr:type II toxin-antitoxin system RelE/ParE family toxin [Candidatus Hydrogenedentota bacterium]
MARLIWTEPALADLGEIAEYIALDNPDAAARFVQKVFDRIERLADYPKSGKRPPELAGTHYREIIVSPCRLFYRVEKNNVYILCVMRSERLLRPYLLQRREEQ